MLNSELDRLHNSQFIIRNSAQRSMSHLRAGSIRSLCDETETDGRAAVRALGADGILIEKFVLILFEPHQL